MGLCLAPTSGASTAVGIFRLGRFRHPPMKLGGGVCFRGIGGRGFAPLHHISFGLLVSHPGSSAY